jgi:hypothetical protein
MANRVFQQSYHVPGTLAANVTITFKAPFDMHGHVWQTARTPTTRSRRQLHGRSAYLATATWAMAIPRLNL